MTGPAVTSPSAAPPRVRRRGRWGTIIAVSLFVHLTLLDLLPHWSLAPADDALNDAPLQVTLMPPIRAVEEPAVAPTVPARSPAPERRPRVRPPKTIAPAFVPESVDDVPQVELTAPLPPGPQVTSPSAPAPAPFVAAAPAQAAESPPEVPPVAIPVVATVPQSARLSYRVVSLDAKNAEPTHYYGVGTIDWSIDGDRYRSELDASYKALFIKVGVLALHSEGTVGPRGLAPERYTEKPFRRATVATNFNRDTRQSITFSSSQASVPLVAGAQDRLSILFQIGGLLLADPRQAGVGGHIEMPVAGVRGDVETWTFESHGGEALDTGVGPLATTHLRRTPGLGSNDRTIDVWIAQDNGGYPAKVLYTEPNGTTIEMTLDGIGAVAKTTGADPPTP